MSATDILNWNFQTNGTVKGTKLGVYIAEDLSNEEYSDWNFIINCSKIREFKKLMEMDYQEFEAHLRQHKREGKINEVIL